MSISVYTALFVFTCFAGLLSLMQIKQKKKEVVPHWWFGIADLLIVLLVINLFIIVISLAINII